MTKELTRLRDKGENPLVNSGSRPGGRTTDVGVTGERCQMVDTDQSPEALLARIPDDVATAVRTRFRVPLSFGLPQRAQSWATSAPHFCHTSTTQCGGSVAGPNQ